MAGAGLVNDRQAEGSQSEQAVERDCPEPEQPSRQHTADHERLNKPGADDVEAKGSEERSE